MIVKNLVLYILGRPIFQKIVLINYKLTVRALGYDNHESVALTGEKFFINKISKEGIKISLDIGANYGKYSEEILKKTNSKVYAFEPLKKCHKKLEEIQVKFGERLKIFHYAIGDVNENAEIQYADSNTELASIFKDVNQINYINNDKRQKIIIKTLDSLLDDGTFCDFEKIDLIKIDTEGYEYRVLQGMQKVLENMRPKYIQIENNWHQLIVNKSIYQISKLLPNYDLYQLLPHGMIKRNPILPESNIFRYSNFVFVRK